MAESAAGAAHQRAGPDIVPEHVNPGFQDYFKRFESAAQVPNEKLLFDIFILPPEELYSPGKNRSSSIGQIISCYRR